MTQGLQPNREKAYFQQQLDYKKSLLSEVKTNYFLESQQTSFFSSLWSGFKLHKNKLQADIVCLEREIAKRSEEDSLFSIDDLEERAYEGDEDAINKLSMMAKDRINAPSQSKYVKSILEKIAESGNSDTNALLLKHFHRDGDILQAIIRSDSPEAQRAVERFADVMDTQSIRDFGQPTTGLMKEALDVKMKELIVSKLADKPEQNIHLLSKFADTYAGIAALQKIAIEKPQTHAGKLACRALVKTFLTQSEKMSNTALYALIKAGIAGNEEAVRSLAKVVRGASPSDKKGEKAIDALVEIARKSPQKGSNDEGSALGALIGLATDKTVTPKFRKKSVEALGKLIEEGLDPQMHATDALIKLARFDQNQRVAGAARDSIFKAAKKDSKVLDRAVPLFFDVANSRNKVDSKTKGEVIELLGKAVDANSSNSAQAIKGLFTLARQPDQMVARKSAEQLEQTGLIKRQTMLETPLDAFKKQEQNDRISTNFPEFNPIGSLSEEKHSSSNPFAPKNAGFSLLS